VTRLFILFALVLTAAAPASAGECRPTLRPLLTDAAPDPVALAAVRSVCRGEADAGDVDALYQLALFHLGLGGEWQPAAAIPMITVAAAAGVPEAQYWLGWQHESGDLLERDEAVALGWYQRAASANHRLALARLADAHTTGELGLSRDAVLAAEYRARQARCLKPALATTGAAESTGD
jgi:TPR repeat protein